MSFFTQFHPKTIKKGQDYYQQGHVKEFQAKIFSTTEIKITSIVAGSKDSLYHTSISLNMKDSNTVNIEGTCSCPVGSYCKHIVATLFDLNSTQKSKNPHFLEPDKTCLWDEWASTLTPAKPIVKPLPSRDTIVYVLNVKTSHHDAPVVEVAIRKSRLLKKGGFGVFQEISPHSAAWVRNATALDAHILLHIEKHTTSTYNSTFRLDFPSSEDVFKQIIETKKAFWGEDSRTPLTLTTPRHFNPTWELLENGLQHLECALKEGGTILPLSPPWFIDPDKHLCGKITSNFDLGSLQPLLDAPVITPNEVADFKRLVKQKKLPLPLPKTLEVKPALHPPKLHLTLFGADSIERYSWGDEDEIYPLIELSFLYDNVKIDPLDSAPTCFKVSKGKVFEMQRDFKKEQALIEKLQKENKAAPLEEVYEYKHIDSDKKHYWTFKIEGSTKSKEKKKSSITSSIASWEKQGLSIEIEETFPYPILLDDYTWYIDTSTDGAKEWFNLELGIEVNGEKLNLLPTLVSIIENNPYLLESDISDCFEDEKMLTFKLPQGQCVELPLQKIKGILATLRELHNPSSLKKGKLKLSRLRAGDLLDLECHWAGKSPLKDLANKLRHFKGIKHVAPSPHLQALLRPYQQEGLNWLQFLKEYKLGGILADDMGLGKTLQILAHLSLEKEQTPNKKTSLVLAPTSLIGNWEKELRRFTPNLSFVTLFGSNRKTSYASIPDVDVVFTTYPLLIRDEEELTKHFFYLLILDEAQAIKNAHSKCAKITKKLKADHKICLTGTPMENHLGELWSLFDFASPGFLGTLKEFNQTFRNPIEKEGNLSLQKILAKRVSPFMLRRTKEKVAKELPQKTEITQTIELEGGQKELYEGVRLAMHTKVKKALQDKGLASSQIIILDALLKLRQTCCDPRLLSLESAKQVKLSAKFTFLQEMLVKLLDEKRNILIFSSFTSMLHLIEDHLKEKKIPYSKLTGQTKHRQKEIDNFQQGAHQIFLISLKAGGVGLNLTKADTVIHYDPWWNPAAENQATDRAYRLGQEKPVFVYKLITKNTVEEKMIKMQERKKKLMDGLFAPGSKKHSTLTLEDLEDLFEPISSTVS